MDERSSDLWPYLLVSALLSIFLPVYHSEVNVCQSTHHHHHHDLTVGEREGAGIDKRGRWERVGLGGRTRREWWDRVTAFSRDNSTYNTPSLSHTYILYISFVPLHTPHSFTPSPITIPHVSCSMCLCSVGLYVHLLLEYINHMHLMLIKQPYTVSLICLSTSTSPMVSCACQVRARMQKLLILLHIDDMRTCARTHWQC